MTNHCFVHSLWTWLLCHCGLLTLVLLQADQPQMWPLPPNRFTSAHTSSSVDIRSQVALLMNKATQHGLSHVTARVPPDLDTFHHCTISLTECSHSAVLSPHPYNLPDSFSVLHGCMCCSRRSEIPLKSSGLTSVKCGPVLFPLCYMPSLAQPSPPDFRIIVHVVSAYSFLPGLMLLAPLPSLVPVWCQQDTSFPMAQLPGLQEHHTWIHLGTIQASLQEANGQSDQ